MQTKKLSLHTDIRATLKVLQTSHTNKSTHFDSLISESSHSVIKLWSIWDSEKERELRKIKVRKKMLEGKGMIKETDMADVKMQMQAMACASQALDLHDVLDCISIAAHIKKVLFLFIY